MWEAAQEELALLTEIGAPVELTRLDYTTARLTDSESVGVLNKRGEAEVLTRTVDGALVAVFADKWRVRAIEREYPDVTLTPMLAAGVAD